MDLGSPRIIPWTTYGGQQCPEVWTSMSERARPGGHKRPGRQRRSDLPPPYLGKIPQIEGVVTLGGGWQELGTDGVVHLNSALHQWLCHILDVLVEVLPTEIRQKYMKARKETLDIHNKIQRHITLITDPKTYLKKDPRIVVKIRVTLSSLISVKLMKFK